MQMHAQRLAGLHHHQSHRLRGALGPRQQQRAASRLRLPPAMVFTGIVQGTAEVGERWGAQESLHGAQPS